MLLFVLYIQFLCTYKFTMVYLLSPVATLIIVRAITNSFLVGSYNMMSFMKAILYTGPAKIFVLCHLLVLDTTQTYIAFISGMSCIQRFTNFVIFLVFSMILLFGIYCILKNIFVLFKHTQHS